MRAIIDGDAVMVCADDFTNLHDSEVAWVDLDSDLGRQLVELSRRDVPPSLVAAAQDLLDAAKQMQALYHLAVLNYYTPSKDWRDWRDADVALDAAFAKAEGKS